MRTREEVLNYGKSFPGVYVDTPFRDDNWVLLRHKENKKTFALTYALDGVMRVNVKVSSEWRDFWRQTYASVLPGYHQNKEHWNTILLDGSVAETDIRRMIAESYDLTAKKSRK